MFQKRRLFLKTSNKTTNTCEYLVNSLVNMHLHIYTWMNLQARYQHNCMLGVLFIFNNNSFHRVRYVLKLKIDTFIFFRMSICLKQYLNDNIWIFKLITLNNLSINNKKTRQIISLSDIVTIWSIQISINNKHIIMGVHIFHRSTRYVKLHFIFESRCPFNDFI